MSETSLGQIAALLALACAGYAVVASVLGSRLRRFDLVVSGQRAVVAAGVLTAGMTGALVYALVTHDFSVAYVAEYSNRQASALYDVSSLWAGQAGSLMFWCLLLNGFALVVLWSFRDRRDHPLLPWVVAVLMGYHVFFLGLINFVVVSPWARLVSAPVDGVGLMALLQNSTMLIHPPMLYLGYVACAVPFAFVVAALVTGRVDDEWIVITRRWTLFAWFCLGCGLLLGASWAYAELGWGGFWAWDPVENVALMPWLTATALLHSLLMQQRRGMLKIWNPLLVMTTFALTLFGTFMNRSGVASSVHSFEGDGLGIPFALLIGLTLVGCVVLVYWRLPVLHAAVRISSFFSRESAFLFNNLLLVGLTFTILWGTVFPLLSEAVRGAAGRVTVGAPFFNRVTGPLFFLLLLLMAAGPLFPWRQGASGPLLRRLSVPAFTLVLATIAVEILIHRVAAALAIGACAALIASTLGEFYRGSSVKRGATGLSWPRALVHVIDSNHSRYGGYLVHLGVALAALGIAGSTLLKTDNQAALRLGQSLAIGGYRATPVSIVRGSVAGVGPSWTVVVRLQRGRETLGVLAPRLVLFTSPAAGDQAVGVPSIYASPLGDVYATVASIPLQGVVRVHVVINPLLPWLWIGGVVIVVGGLVSFSPSRHERRRVTSHVRVPGAATA